MAVSVEIPDSDIHLLLEYICTRLPTMPQPHAGAFVRLRTQLQREEIPPVQQRWREWAAARVEARHP